MKNELIEEQDQHLDEINEIAGRLKIQGKEISKEIDKQGVLVRDLDQEVDKTTNKLNFVQDKLSKLRHALSRVGDEGFGLCARCGKPIPVMRVALMPQSPYCVHCAQ